MHRPQGTRRRPRLERCSSTVCTAALSLVLLVAHTHLAWAAERVITCPTAGAGLEARVACGELGETLSTLIDRFAGFGFSGAVLVAQDDRILLHRAYGLADVDTGQPNSIATRFPLLSVTKPMVATGLLLLADEGKLDLDSPLSLYLGDFPEAKSAATAHQLLTHTAGLIEEGFSTRSPEIGQFIANVKAAPIDSPPGEEWRYSNAGYSFATALMELIAERPWDEYLQLSVFRRAQMEHTAVLRGAFPEDVASGHLGVGPDRRTMNFIDAPPYVSELWWGAAGATGVVSTVADVYRWIDAIGDGRLLSSESRQRMFTAHLRDQGYGWHIDDYEGRVRYWKGGGAPMYQYQVAWYPDTQYIVVIAMNDHNGWRVPLWSTIERVLFGDEAAPLPAVLGPAGWETERLAGTYRSESSDTVELVYDTGQLVYSPLEVAEESPLPGAPFVFKRTASGLAGVALRQGQADIRIIGLRDSTDTPELLLPDGTAITLEPAPDAPEIEESVRQE